MKLITKNRFSYFLHFVKSFQILSAFCISRGVTIQWFSSNSKGRKTHDTLKIYAFTSVSFIINTVAMSLPVHVVLFPPRRTVHHVRICWCSNPFILRFLLKSCRGHFNATNRKLTTKILMISKNMIIWTNWGADGTKVFILSVKLTKNATLRVTFLIINYIVHVVIKEVLLFY